TVNMQDIAGEVGSPITYKLYLVTKATAYGGHLTDTRTLPQVITVEKESLDFTIDFDWTA
ncbi:MAG: hypothetical protein ACP5D2_03970, partial [Candidatus Nanoarchaeia archaeon]